MHLLNIDLLLHQIKSKMKPEVLQQLATEFGSPLYVYDAENQLVEVIEPDGAKTKKLMIGMGIW